MISRSAVTDILVTTLCLLVVAAIFVQIRESKAEANHKLLQAIHAKLELTAQSLEDVRRRLLRVEEEGK
jgi:hypothetical protein